MATWMFVLLAIPVKKMGEINRRDQTGLRVSDK